MKHLKNNNVPIALATSSSKTTGDIKTQRWEHIFDLFHHKVYGGTDPEVEKGKPHPDIFLIAAQRFPDKPEPSKVFKFIILFLYIYILNIKVILKNIT